MNGTALIVADGKEGLTDHGSQSGLRDGQAVELLYGRQLREFLGIGTQNIKLAHAALNIDHIVISRKDDHIVRHFPHDLAKETGRENQGPFFFNLCRNGSTDAGFQIVTGQTQFISSLQKNSFQGGNGAFCCNCSGGGRYRGEQQGFLAGEFHRKNLRSISLFLREDRINFRNSSP